MQDRYAGDVGDFGKFGLLRAIADTGLRVGVNWYLTYKLLNGNWKKHFSKLDM